MSDQVALLQKKLSAAIAQRQQVEMTRQTQVTTLAQFVSKLSLVCKGSDIELDNRLARFRKTLASGVSFELLLPILDEINALLAKHESTQNSQLKTLTNTIKHAGSSLQKHKGLSAELRRSLRHLLNDKLPEVQTTHGFVPIFEQLIALYSHVLQAKQLSEQPMAETAQINENAQLKLVQEFIALSSELNFDGEFTARINRIQNELSNKPNLDTALHAGVDIMRLVSVNLSTERQSAQQFLAVFNKNLAELQQTLISTTEEAKQLDGKIANLYKQIDDNINNLSEQTASATSITALKEIVDQRLGSLTTQLAEKERLESQQRAMLKDTVGSMAKRINSLEDELNNYKTQLEEQREVSLLDQLTKLPNRAAFNERFAIEQNSARRNQLPLCLAVLDIDRFKSINDTYGHSAGDKTLQVIASALKKSIRVTDFIARFGGEEFVLLMPNVTLENAHNPLEKLRMLIKSIPFKFKQQQVQITISMGVTQLNHQDTFETAFDRADKALYQAKNTGRDRIVEQK